jgi:hypothetical protein
MTNAASQDEYPRPLTEREAEILDFLLGINEHRLAPLREQARTAVVAGTCACGCATIDLAVDRESGGPANLCSPVVSADSRPNTGVPAVGLLLFLDEGWLSLLEIWYIDAPPAEFPAATVFHTPRFECDRRPGDIADTEPPRSVFYSDTLVPE